MTSATATNRTNKGHCSGVSWKMAGRATNMATADRRSSRTTTTLGAGWSTYLGSLEVMAPRKIPQRGPSRRPSVLPFYVPMSRWAKFGIVMAGYGAAIVAGWLASWQYNARVAGLPYDTSGGMYAAGEAMYSTAAFLVVALVPTLLLLWFLRHHEGFWNTMSVASLAFAAVGLLAVFSPLLVPATAIELVIGVCALVHWIVPASRI